MGPAALGVWLAVTSVWPAVQVKLHLAQFLWQPLLVLSVAVLAVRRSRRVGWNRAVGQSLWTYAVFTLAAWLPSLRIPEIYRVLPTFFEAYLSLYKGILAALIGLQAGNVLRGDSNSWWVRDGWSRPLVIAPLLLMLRSVGLDAWPVLLGGTAVGLALGLLRPWRWVTRKPSATWGRLVPVAVFLVGGLLAFGAGLRIYRIEGQNFPAASDDGPDYYRMAVAMAQEPGLFWTPKLEDETYFSGYYPVMALWFRLVGPSIPSWLIWHGVAGGLLALLGYWLGRRFGGTLCGLVMAGLFVADRVMLHLLATMNMETFFIPLLYLALWLWIVAADRPPTQQKRLSLAAGLALGLATVVRPTAILLPGVLVMLLLVERPRQARPAWAGQGRWMLLGMAIPVLLLVVRHRIAWGYWTLSGTKAVMSARNNYALEIQGQHLVDIGLWPWLRLVADDPGVLVRTVIPGWWEQGLKMWTHPGFGQMDLLRGLSHQGFYQTAFASVLAAGTLVGLVVALRRRTRAHLVCVALPVYFTALVIGFYVLNSRYRAPFIPALYLLCGLGFLQAMALDGEDQK